MKYKLQRSRVDPRYVEVIEGEEVVQEILVLFPLKGVPVGFRDLPEIVAWLEEAEEKGARAFSYRQLAMRSLPKSVLLKKLEEKGFSKKVGDKVIEEVEALGYLNDDDYRKRVIEKEWRKGYGPRVIEKKLRALGLEETGVRNVIGEERQIEMIQKWAKKGKGRSLFQALFRRGFDVHVIQKVL